MLIMLSATNYAQNYAGIIGKALPLHPQYIYTHAKVLCSVAETLRTN